MMEKKDFDSSIYFSRDIKDFLLSGTPNNGEKICASLVRSKSVLS